MAITFIRLQNNSDNFQCHFIIIINLLFIYIIFRNSRKFSLFKQRHQYYKIRLLYILSPSGKPVISISMQPLHRTMAYLPSHREKEIIINKFPPSPSSSSYSFIIIIILLLMLYMDLLFSLGAILIKKESRSNH